ncbi:hypothetical protein C7M61_003377 [Candidozyma pseudohaemuli]|uniref:F-box domain-containing protein n=1 Tax=Candidozyma pseudohaemuli TaxID=418784 RepID=A0A2P7YP03_9ASCO|nr:hypothetical protein C7M61_003377 [[Candida] pseudohaemulonii]PSK37670.1 hypothetical protein C7M61_003377 [[Candida] pseudohaemulonii]
MDSLGNTAPSSDEVHHQNVHINDLPDEVLLNVFAHMQPVELKDLRLVCSKWNHVVLDKSAWIKAFHNRFGTGNVFASVTGLTMWLTEYLGRVAVARKWAKARAYSHSYALVNNEFGMRVPPRVFVDFAHDRILTFARFLGAISMCTLSTGRNQVFFPENSVLSMGMAVDSNWSHLCVGKPNGEVLLKNLITSSATGLGKQSVTTLQGPTDDPIVALKLNETFEKVREKVEIVAGTRGGLLLLWSATTLLRTIFVSQTCGVLEVESDFTKSVVVVTEEEIIAYELSLGEETHRVAHGIALMPHVNFRIDLADMNVVAYDETTVKVFHLAEEVFVRETEAPEEVSIIGGKLQQSDRKVRNSDVAGGDGRLFALIFSDGSVGTFNIRDTSSEIKLLTRIMPRYDAPFGIFDWTAVALNSSTIAIGLLPNFVHFYDSHLGEYLREGVKVLRKLFREGEPPIRHMSFSSNQAAGVVVSGSVAQYFRFGDAPLSSKRKPNTPQAAEGSSRHAMHRHIKAQLDDYDTLEDSRRRAELMADRYNGTELESEAEELRMAMALSASSVPDTSEDDDLERALALSREELERVTPLEGTLRSHELFKQPATGHPGEPIEESDDDILRQVIEISLTDI